MRDKFEEWAGPEYGEYTHGFDRRDMFKSYLQGRKKAVLDERERIAKWLRHQGHIELTQNYDSEHKIRSKTLYVYADRIERESE